MRQKMLTTCKIMKGYKRTMHIEKPNAETYFQIGDAN